jgi:hypothetical protein
VPDVAGEPSREGAPPSAGGGGPGLSGQLLEAIEEASRLSSATLAILLEALRILDEMRRSPADGPS